ncbi:hypothetical protein HSX37_01895|uniref:UbiA prenyltransferase family protein n=1 Tax=Dendrosporobacter quercicolus TaxID=146817 RepID=A0A1G9LSA1_9FIRM|nr:hypothetical protein [Dendrosporobacter quercicolus]NSL46808.1 hypothetical protein [Dendrosporobacter quercicolus DSM 1736]SDL64654.1 hypothetical protein SAMN04488502_101447 [Dendrosporobacter quercicolus]
MSPAIFEFACIALAVLLCALAVKLTDDFLDRDLDAAAGQNNWTQHLGSGTPVYAMLLLAVSAGLRADICLPLFLSSYITGMFNDLRQPFPSRLTGWQECLLVLAAGAILFSWNIMLFSLLFIIAVQLADDCLDYSADLLSGQRNFAHRFGIVESLLLAIIALLLSCWLNPALFGPVLCGAGLFYLSLFYKEALKW